MSLDLLLAELKAPCTLEGLADVVERVEQKMRDVPASFWQAEGAKRYEDTYVAVLLSRIRFFILAVEVQNQLLREIVSPTSSKRRK